MGKHCFEMITVNSLSGGKTSSYLAANYRADYNVFALVRTNDKKCLFPDYKVRQMVSDKLGGVEFIGTLEEDMIVYTMLDLEQYIGQEIHWVTGKTFDEIILRGKKKYLPNVTQRFCTELLKIDPMFRWWKENFTNPVKMRIGYRANERSRVDKMNSRRNNDGLITFHDIVGKRKDGKNRWAYIGWQDPVFPLVKDGIFKDHIEEWWKGRPVRFAYLNNCVGCFHRNPILLKFMSEKQPEKFQWFIDQEGCGYRTRTFKNGITYQKIKDHPMQIQFNYDDFDDCDSGYCGL